MPAANSSNCEGSSTLSPSAAGLSLEASWSGVCPACGQVFTLGYAGFLPEHRLPDIEPPRPARGSKKRVAPSVGERIRARRKELGLSQGALASGGVSRTYISLVERNMRNPSAKALRAIAPVLGVSQHWLETGETAPAEELAQLVLSHPANVLSPRSRALARHILTADGSG